MASGIGESAFDASDFVKAVHELQRHDRLPSALWVGYHRPFRGISDAHWLLRSLVFLRVEWRDC